MKYKIHHPSTMNGDWCISDGNKFNRFFMVLLTEKRDD